MIVDEFDPMPDRHRVGVADRLQPLDLDRGQPKEVAGDHRLPGRRLDNLPDSAATEASGVSGVAPDTGSPSTTRVNLVA